MADCEVDLPKAVVKKLVKAKLEELASRNAGEKKKLQLNQEALLALSEGGKIFVHYLTASASAISKSAGRQTISEEDVYSALRDLQFGEFVDAVSETVREFKTHSKKGTAAVKS